jgi:hypothetical protein
MHPGLLLIRIADLYVYALQDSPHTCWPAAHAHRYSTLVNFAVLLVDGMPTASLTDICCEAGSVADCQRDIYCERDAISTASPTRYPPRVRRNIHHCKASSVYDYQHDIHCNCNCDRLSDWFGNAERVGRIQAIRSGE